MKALLTLVFMMGFQPLWSVEWSVDVEEAFLIDELVRHDSSQDQGLRVVEKIDGMEFLVIRGSIATTEGNPDDPGLKVDAKSVSAAAGDKSFLLYASQWNAKHFAKGLSYFTLLPEKERKEFCWIFAIPTDLKPDALKIFEKSIPIEVSPGKRPHPADTAAITIKEVGYVDKLFSNDEKFLLPGSERNTFQKGSQVLSPVAGRLLGVTLSATPNSGGYRKPDQWHYTFHSFGIIVNGRWSPAITEAKPDGSDFLKSGGGILVKKTEDGWNPSSDKTFFFNVPDDCKEFEITLCGKVVAKGAVSP